MSGLAAVGVILTPIYLLSMLREIFFGKENSQLSNNTNLVDAEPREIYIIGCLLVPIIAIGLYPRLMTDSYRASIEALVALDLNAMEMQNKLSPSSEKNIIPSPAFISAPQFHFPNILKN